MHPTASSSARRRDFAFAALMLLLAAASTVANVARAQSAAVVGVYDGGQMEMAAGLELKPDGRFNYALSYGALDEQAAGKWTVRGDSVLLTSDPIVAPRFVLVSHGRGADGLLRVDLDVPRGVSRQYFDALITLGNGQTRKVQLSDEGLLLPFARGDVPASLRMLLPVFSVLGEPVKLDRISGYSVRFRFDPNDLGKVDFRAEPLRILNGDLMLDRHGRSIRFKRARQ
ncbi:MAG TPA: hypothetical protein VGF07_01915 [Stellaceae bacterium]|jgi:hypothetical protein